MHPVTSVTTGGAAPGGAPAGRSAEAPPGRHGGLVPQGLRDRSREYTQVGRKALRAAQGTLSRTPDLARAVLVSERYRSHTMIGRRRFVDNLVLAMNLAPPGGEVVECGVWRGGMSRALADVLGPGRTYHLFDSFKGLPPAGENDGPAAVAYQLATDAPNYYDNCTADEADARSLFDGSGLDVHFHAGWFEDTLLQFEPEKPITVLRLDGDWYDSTLTCMRALVPRLAPNALVLIDDYYSWEGCTRAVHDYLAETGRPLRIRQSAMGSCYIVNTVA